MEEKRIIRIAVICSVLGLIGLVLIAGSIKPVSLDTARAGDIVKIEGKVGKVTAAGDREILDIKYEKRLRVVVSDAGETGIMKGDRVAVTGILEEYRGKQKVSAREIRIKRKI